MASAQTLSSDPPFPRAWWKSATVYEIFPHSFFDSNGDGVGDLNGIRAKLDYLKDLGVDVLWLTPIYRSPHADMGYDVSDYFDIDPQYGTMEDWDQLVRGVHERGMKILMDLVANHTSHEHPWFKESRSSKDNPKRDWYIWRPPRYEHGLGHPPNNWASVLQGPAWEFDSKTREYYLHLFTRQQPDLNWDNPAVRKAMAKVMRFWITKGCDGFRMDAINAISKRDGLPDAKVTDHLQYYQRAPELWANGPRVHEYLQEIIREGLSGNLNAMTVGEAAFTFDPDVIGAYVFPENKELNENFNFELNGLDEIPAVPLTNVECELKDVKKVVEKWQTYGREKGFWNTLFLENHDTGRAITRFLDDSPAYRTISAKMLAILQVTQTGTMYLYQGQEIGMKNFPRTWGIEEYKDVATQVSWNIIKEQRQKETGEENPYMKDILDDYRLKARDHARIPVQWDATDNVGFTTGTPWMRAYKEDAREGWNVADESQNPESVLAFWKQAIRTRKENDVLVYGDFKKIAVEHGSVFAYARRLGNKTAWVAVNLGEEATEVSLKTTDGLGLVHGLDVGNPPQLALCNYDHASSPPGLTADALNLQGFEARVYIQ